MEILTHLPVFAGAAAFVVFVSALSTFYQGVRPFKFVSNATPADFDVEFERSGLKTEDGLELDAWYVPARSRTDRSVIVMHGYPADKGNVLPATIFLQEMFNLLFFDFRYLGKSGGKYSSLGYHEQKDLAAAVKCLRALGQRRIGLYGFSMGGAVALMGAEENGVDAVVADSPYASLGNMLHHSYRYFGPFRLLFTATTAVLARLILNADIKDVSPVESAKRLDLPVLVIHGTDDDQIPVQNAHELKEANGKIDLWLLEGVNHNSGRAFSDNIYEEKIGKFFRDGLS